MKFLAFDLNGAVGIKYDAYHDSDTILGHRTFCRGDACNYKPSEGWTQYARYKSRPWENNFVVTIIYYN